MAEAPAFSKQVAPILFNHCVGCYLAGEVGSAVPLVSYEAAKSWAASIKNQVLKRTMPPRPTDSAHRAKFSNDARLSLQDFDTLVAWVDAGAPEGNDSDLPRMPDFTQEWQHFQGRAPDVVVSLPEYSVAASGEVPYIQVRVRVPLARDRWITALQVRPGNSALVHRMAITEIKMATR